MWHLSDTLLHKLCISTKPKINMYHVKSVIFISKIKIFLSTCKGFIWRYMPTSSVLMTNDVIVHVGYLIIALVSVQWCLCLCRSRWLPLFVWFFCLALYQWFSLPPRLWCDVQSLLGLLGRICWSYTHLPLFLAPCVFLIVRVVYVLHVFIQSCFQQSPSLSNILGITVLALYLVHQLTTPC